MAHHTWVQCFGTTAGMANVSSFCLDLLQLPHSLGVLGTYTMPSSVTVCNLNYRDFKLQSKTIREVIHVYCAFLWRLISHVFSYTTKTYGYFNYEDRSNLVYSGYKLATPLMYKFIPKHTH